MIKGYGEKLDKLYQEIRYNNSKKQNIRLKNICTTNPEILTLKNNIKILSFQLMKSPNSNNSNQLKLKINEIRSKIKNILNDLNLPENYLDTIYTCSLCNDTGYILTQKCSCLISNLTKLYLKESELKLSIINNNFENFNFSFYSDDIIKNSTISPSTNIKNIYANILTYIKTFKTNKLNLLFNGECGSGKTFMTHCIAKDLLDSGYSVLYKTSEDLFTELFNYSNNKIVNRFNESINDSFLIQCDLLIIDDLGTENQNKLYPSIFFNFINKKLFLNKKMIISTNFTLRDLQQTYSDRIFSRIIGNFKVYNFFVHEDIRIQQKQIKR
ncbi:ATP-binding protein [Candidatus Arthromitus sp. SFB-rat-Yit]|uniref:ATP-binding protein n=1 Tax=Candidatus Arthromitus sp. SFB-rat-Yit TaxID=1041504 RepID=UPI000227A84D|nr:ATP-binding protein [Candidatus Arthromitus sp. SFB-rat-Yit]BAK81892.1 putative DNA replication protein DnaC [Candidatus Arthromitus sp. SFB-rat-Yit]